MNLLRTFNKGQLMSTIQSGKKELKIKSKLLTHETYCNHMNVCISPGNVLKWDNNWKKHTHTLSRTSKNIESFKSCSCQNQLIKAHRKGTHRTPFARTGKDELVLQHAHTHTHRSRISCLKWKRQRQKARTKSNTSSV